MKGARLSFTARATDAGHQREGASSIVRHPPRTPDMITTLNPATKWLEEMAERFLWIIGKDEQFSDLSRSAKRKRKEKELVLASPRRATDIGHQRESASSSSDIIHVHLDETTWRPCYDMIEEMNTDKWKGNWLMVETLGFTAKGYLRRTPT